MTLPGQDPRTPLPPRRRGALYAFIGVCTALGVVSLLGRDSPGGDPYGLPDFDPPTDPGYGEGFVADEPREPADPFAGEAVSLDEEPSALFELPSRESEAVGLGYRTEMAWREIQVRAGESGSVTVDATTGVDYLVLARTSPDCDADIYVTQEILDDRIDADASVQFSVSFAMPVVVEFPIYSSERAVCTLGFGVYGA